MIHICLDGSTAEEQLRVDIAENQVFFAPFSWSFFFLIEYYTYHIGSPDFQLAGALTLDSAQRNTRLYE